jgi:hypothetical protein
MVLAAAVLLAGYLPPAGAAEVVDFYKQITDPEQRLYFRTLLSKPDGDDMVYYWKGYVYVDVPGDVLSPKLSHGGGPPVGKAIFGFEGYNIRRVIPDPTTPGDFLLGTREIVFYTDPATGVLLKEWTNPLTGAKVPVVPVINEYLFSTYTVDGGVLKSVTKLPLAPYRITTPVAEPQEWGDQLVWYSDVFPQYTLSRYGIYDPMGLKTGTLFANGKYTSAEIFEFWAPQWSVHFLNKELRGKGKWILRNWIPNVKLTWVRIGPWLPWMGASEDEFEGRVVYHVRSELLDSYHAMPADFRAKMDDYFKDPKSWQNVFSSIKGLEGWQKAPEATDYAHYTTRTFGKNLNDTSWSVFYDKVLKPLGQTWDQWCESPKLPVEKPQ